MKQTPENARRAPKSQQSRQSSSPSCPRTGADSESRPRPQINNAKHGCNRPGDAPEARPKRLAYRSLQRAEPLVCQGGSAFGDGSVEAWGGNGGRTGQWRMPPARGASSIGPLGSCPAGPPWLPGTSTRAASSWRNCGPRTPCKLMDPFLQKLRNHRIHQSRSRGAAAPSTRNQTIEFWGAGGRTQGPTPRERSAREGRRLSYVT